MKKPSLHLNVASKIGIFPPETRVPISSLGIQASTEAINCEFYAIFDYQERLNKCRKNWDAKFGPGLGGIENSGRDETGFKKMLRDGTGRY